VRRISCAAGRIANAARCAPVARGLFRVARGPSVVRRRVRPFRSGGRAHRTRSGARCIRWRSHASWQPCPHARARRRTPVSQPTMRHRPRPDWRRRWRWRWSGLLRCRFVCSQVPAAPGLHKFCIRTWKPLCAAAPADARHWAAWRVVEYRIEVGSRYCTRVHESQSSLPSAVPYSAAGPSHGCMVASFVLLWPPVAWLR
jgi:hypothetical protein